MVLKVVLLITLLAGAPFAQNVSGYWQIGDHAQGLIRAAILQANQGTRTNINKGEAKVLSKKIVQVAKCMDLDPVMFAALIWRESHFRHVAQSETGAVGMTQLTKPGIQEVLERLAENSWRKKDLIRMQVASCYPKIFKQIPKNIDVEDIAQWKQKIKNSLDMNLVFGAVLLKSYLDRHQDYQIAFEKYNGDPRIKVRFAQEVLALNGFISNSLIQMPQIGLNSSKFLASIQGF